MSYSAYAWPLAFVAACGIGYATVQSLKPAPVVESVVEVTHPSPTVLQDVRALARLETLTLHLEKVVDVKDHQKHLYGLVDADDSLLFVAQGEVVLGVDLSKVQTARFEEATHTAYIDLPSVEVLSSRFDEGHSYVHSRATDVLARRNEALEGTARRDALAAFEAAGREPANVARAKEQAERELTTLAKGWGASQVVVTWRDDATAALPEK